MTIAERLVKIRKSSNPKMTQEDFAKSIGLTRQRYKNYEYDTIPDEAVIRLICITHHINREWLETGEGNMRSENSEIDLPQEIAILMRGRDPMDIAVMTSLASMPDEWWSMWRKSLYEAYEKATKKDRG